MLNSCVWLVGTMLGSVALKARRYIIDSLFWHRNILTSLPSWKSSLLIPRLLFLVLLLFSPAISHGKAPHGPDAAHNGCSSSIASYSSLCCPGDQWPRLSQNAFELDLQGWHSARSPSTAVTSSSLSSTPSSCFLKCCCPPTFHWEPMTFLTLPVYRGISSVWKPCPMSLLTHSPDIDWAPARLWKVLQVWHPPPVWYLPW